MEKTIHYIPFKKGTENFCRNNDIATDNNITNEFNFFGQYIDLDQEHENNLSKGETEKDRYSNIKPYNHNIINISTGSKYINASPINIPKNKFFISTQGPKKETIEDFWTMVWENECYIIIMLCNEKENGMEKCAKYWDQNFILNNYEIIIGKIIVKKEYTIREIFLFKNSFNEGKMIYQIHFTAWPDHGVPDIKDGKIFDVFIEIIEFVDKLRVIGSIIVHCSAGVGRTGTFISMYILEKEIKIQIENKISVIKFSIFNLVRKLKEMRLYLVQTESQYRFIYEFVKHLLKKYNI